MFTKESVYKLITENKTFLKNNVGTAKREICPPTVEIHQRLLIIPL